MGIVLEELLTRSCPDGGVLDIVDLNYVQKGYRLHVVYRIGFVLQASRHR